MSGDVPLSPDVRRLARSVIRGQGLTALAATGVLESRRKGGDIQYRDSESLGKYEKIYRSNWLTKIKTGEVGNINHAK